MAITRWDPYDSSTSASRQVVRFGMPQMSNELYLAVLPQISLSLGSLGRTEQILTLLPDRNFATEFFKDQVEEYVRVFQASQQALTGGHVQEYQCDREETEDGRVVVKVTQRVK